MSLSITPNSELAAHAYVVQWFELLAAQRWQEALAMLDLPNSYGVVWSEAEVRKALAEYSNGQPCALTSPKALVGKPHISSGAFNDGTGFWFECDFPLNGGWSDLTAQFEFKVNGNHYLVALQDIHVL